MKKYNYPDIVLIKYQNKVQIAEVIELRDKDYIGRIYDAAFPDQYNQIEFIDTDIIGPAPYGEYTCVGNVKSDTVTCPCIINNGKISHVYLFNKWFTWLSAPIAIKAIKNKNSTTLNLVNKKVKLEEAFKSVDANNFQIGQIYEITSEFIKANSLTFQQYIPKKYGIILQYVNGNALIIPTTDISTLRWALPDFQNNNKNKLTGDYACQYEEYPKSAHFTDLSDESKGEIKYGIIKNGVLQGIDGDKYIVILKISTLSTNLKLTNKQVELEENLFYGIQ